MMREMWVSVDRRNTDYFKQFGSDFIIQWFLFISGIQWFLRDSHDYATPVIYALGWAPNWLIGASFFSIGIAHSFSIWIGSLFLRRLILTLELFLFTYLFAVAASRQPFTLVFPIMLSFVLVVIWELVICLLTDARSM